MTRICAWCKQVMGEKEPLEDKRITHTICKNCQPQALMEEEGLTEGETMKKRLDNK